LYSIAISGFLNIFSTTDNTLAMSLTHPCRGQDNMHDKLVSRRHCCGTFDVYINSINGSNQLLGYWNMGIGIFEQGGFDLVCDEKKSYDVLLVMIAMI
jgi:hypothetical protein